MQAGRLAQRGGVRSGWAQRHVRSHAVQLAEVQLFLEEIAVIRAPRKLPALLRVLEQHEGARPLPPSERQGLHPLLIPLCTGPQQGPGAGMGGSRVTCLLRWPDPSKHKGMVLPVVSMQRGARGVRLVARSVDEYLHRMLAEEDLAAPPAGATEGTGGSSRPLAEKAGAEGWELYKTGDAAAGGFTGAKARLYVVRKAGQFPDVCESLSAGHLARGDVTSALVASEYYMRNNFFPGWARPYEFASELFMQLNRAEEARDMARVALRLPWWSLQEPFEAVQATAQFTGKTPQQVKFLLSEEAAAAAQAQQLGNQYKQSRSAQQVALDRAETLLDLAAAGVHPSYDAVRSELAEAYQAAGLSDVANFLNATH